MGSGEWGVESRGRRESGVRIEARLNLCLYEIGEVQVWMAHYRLIPLK
jgi:hypothetical protein